MEGKFIFQRIRLSSHCGTPSIFQADLIAQQTGHVPPSITAMEFCSAHWVSDFKHTHNQARGVDVGQMKAMLSLSKIW